MKNKQYEFLFTQLDYEQYNILSIYAANKTRKTKEKLLFFNLNKDNHV